VAGKPAISESLPTPDKYLRYAAGVDCVSIAKLIAAYKGEAHPLVRQLQRCTAEAERVIAEENEKRGMSNPDVLHIRVPRPGSRNTSYLLRRLARDRPEILAAYERLQAPLSGLRAAGGGIGRPERDARLRAP